MTLRAVLAAREYGQVARINQYGRYALNSTIMILRMKFLPV
jgi:hypothetical protein